MTEQRVSHFEIGEPLGHGGMGEVYRAVDRKLRRVVAVKFVAADRSPGSEADGRLLREARAAAGLNHPNICTVYEAGQVQPGDSIQLANGKPAPVGTPFIAMELVTGTTLRELASGSGKLDSKEVVRLGAQIAAGLAEAHSKGIVHRDLKPENIVVTPEGVAKILDFGLAKPLAQAEGAAASESMTTEFLTAGNLLMGTYPYMSPEQIQRQPVDSRSDVFSFGIILYELLAGRKPFQGETPEQTLAKILEQEPVSVSHVHPGTSPELVRIIHRCLRKDPADRYNDTRDLVVALHDLERGQTGRRPRAWILSLALAGAVVAIVLAIRFVPRPPPSITPPSYSQLTFSGKASAPNLSPDGRYIAFLEGQGNDATRILVQDIHGGEPLEIGKQPHSPFQIRWSPDSNELLYYDQDRKTAILAHHLGRSARTLPGSWYMTWAPDGSRYAFAMGTPNITFVDVAEGRESTVLIEGPFVWVTGLDWSPRGDRLVLNTKDEQERSAIWTVSTTGKELQKILEGRRLLVSARWAPGGEAIYYLSEDKHATDLYKVRIDPGSGRAVGEPALVLAGLEASGLAASFSISADSKTLVYSRTTIRSNLWLLTRAGAEPSVAKQTQLTSGTYQDSWPRLSPDEKTVAFVRSGDIFTLRLDGGPVEQRTFRGNCGEIAWAPDGASIAFGYQNGDSISVWSTDLVSSSPWPLGSSMLNSAAMWREIDVPGLSFLSWAPRDAVLYGDPGSRNYQVLDPTSGARFPLIRKPEGFVFNACSSPVGGDVAVFWRQERAAGLWTINPETGVEHRIARTSTQPIRWSGDGRIVYCFDQDRRQIIGFTKDGLETTEMVLPFERIGGLTMTADGNRVVCSVLEVSQDIWAVENFDPDIH